MGNEITHATLPLSFRVVVVHVPWNEAGVGPLLHSPGNEFTNGCGVTECFCHATLLGATKQVRSAKICPGELFLK